MLAKPISEILHSYITKKLKDNRIQTLIDMGGKGKMKGRGFTVTNADIKYGIDCRKLPFKDNQFDVSMSIATLEHVGNEDDQIAFLNEAVRVAKYKSIHWFPINKDAEDFLNQIGHNHPCVVPNLDLLLKYIDYGYSLDPITSVSQHFLLLASLYEKLNVPQLYEYILKYGDNKFGVILEVTK